MPSTPPPKPLAASNNDSTCPDPTTTMATVLRFIAGITEDEQVDEVLAALQACHDRLEEQRAASVQVGDDIVLRGATPRYLDGLHGTLLFAENGYGTVELTIEATGTLRFMPDNADFVVGSPLRYVLPQVALACCQTLNPRRTAAA